MKQTDRLFVIEGDGGCYGGGLPTDIRRVAVDALELEVESPDSIALLNLGGKILRSTLGAFFRAKRPFALLSLAEFDAQEVSHLAATAKKRKSHAWLLGGLRLLPIVAAAKEVIAGGCLGELAEVRVVYSATGDDADAFLAADTAAWLARGARCGDIAVDGRAEMALGNRRLWMCCTGCSGSLEGAYDWNDRCGSMETSINRHERKRFFSGDSALELEISLLNAMGAQMRDVPGLIPLADLPNAEKTSK